MLSWCLADVMRVFRLSRSSPVPAIMKWVLGWELESPLASVARIWFAAFMKKSKPLSFDKRAIVPTSCAVWGILWPVKMLRDGIVSEPTGRNSRRSMPLIIMCLRLSDRKVAACALCLETKTTFANRDHALYMGSHGFFSSHRPILACSIQIIRKPRMRASGVRRSFSLRDRQ